MEDAGDCISSFFQDTPDSITSTNSLEISYSPSKNCDMSTDSNQNSVNPDTELTLSHLILDEQEPLEIQAFFNITPREMPLSPHYVFEEEFSANPWAMLVATIFLTKTTGKTARPYMKNFFQEFPTPYHILNENPDSIERFFEKLGLRKRGRIIWKLSYQFVCSKWRRASDLCGIGKYGEDAYRIFCLGHTDLDPGDRYLMLYLNWLRNQTDFVQDNSVTDCECILEDPVSKYYRITLRD